MTKPKRTRIERLTETVEDLTIKRDLAQAELDAASGVLTLLKRQVELKLSNP